MNQLRSSIFIDFSISRRYKWSFHFTLFSYPSFLNRNIDNFIDVLNIEWLETWRNFISINYIMTLVYRPSSQHIKKIHYGPSFLISTWLLSNGQSLQSLVFVWPFSVFWEAANSGHLYWIIHNNQVIKSRYYSFLFYIYK